MRKGKQHLLPLSSKRVLVSTSLMLFLSGIGWASPSATEGDATAITAIAQQQKTIKGTVKDAAGESVIGANVIVKGTTNGVITDVDGNFTLTGVPANATLQISYIGYLNQEVKVGNQTDYNITLKEDSQALDEVVVVGYGTQKKTNLTGAVSSVNFEEQALSRPVTTVSAALAGLSAGVQVMQNSGQPGSDGATIRVRGMGTLNNNDPLVLVDGMEGSMDNVNPQDIESISILKDAAACAIYGSRAASGVILITTKKGNQGKINVSYSGRVSYSQPTRIIDLVSNYADYMEWINESAVNIGQKGNFEQSTIDLWREKSKDPNGVNERGVPNYVAFPNTDWQDVIFQQGVINDHNLSVNGGSDKIRFMLSAGYLDNPGLVDNTGITKYNIRTNVEANVTKWLTVGMRSYGSMQDKEVGNFSNANNYLRQTTPGVYPIYNGQYGYAEASEESATANNLLVMLNGGNGSQKKTNFNTTMYSKVDFMKGLSWSFNFNYKRYWYEARAWSHATETVKLSTGEVKSAALDPSKMTTSFANEGNWSYTLENIINYSTTIAKAHNISALLGYQEFYYYGNSSSASLEGLIDENVNVPGAATTMKSIGGGASDKASRSFFGRINYDYNNRYLFEANLRYDGHSRYHTDHRYGAFPSFSAGWRISEEEFMEKTRSWMDSFKLRLSWGKLGNNGGDDVGNYEYQALYNITDYSFGGKQVSGLAQMSISNSLLSWESAATTNIGLDFAFLKNRLTAEFDIYDKKTTGILYRPNIYITMGGLTAPRLNIAEVGNKGFETTIGWRDRVGKVNYSVSGNFAYNRNEVTKYKGTLKQGWEVDPATGKKKWVSNLGDVSTGSTSRVLEGKMMNEYYMKSAYSGNQTYFNTDGSVNKNGGPRDGIIRTEKDMEWVKAMMADGCVFWPNKTIGKNKIWYGDMIYADANGDNEYGNADDSEFQGVSKDPKFTFGLQASASWKGFDISMAWAGAAGRKLYWSATSGYNSTSTRVGLGLSKEIAYNHYFYDPENPDNPKTNLNAKYPRLTLGESGSQNVETSTHFLYNANYLKLKNLTLGYTLPERWSKRLFTQNVRFYLSGENLFSFDSFPGQDPELGADPTYTSVRSFAFGANITF